ncbi:cupin domain-containing protein [Candidatus Dojkabacteria bacterium]|nr:cupin domain-containing protein [Candidatus Dojkabacteria bacterium]
MLIQNIADKKFKSIPAHGGEGLIHMKFFHQEYQRFREVDDLPEPDPSYERTQWNFIAYAELPTGSTIAEHEHKDNDEFYFILEGEAMMRVDDDTKKIKKGDIVLTRAGSKHSVYDVKKRLKFFAFEILQRGN